MVVVNRLAAHRRPAVVLFAVMSVFATATALVGVSGWVPVIGRPGHAGRRLDADRRGHCGDAAAARGPGRPGGQGVRCLRPAQCRRDRARLAAGRPAGRAARPGQRDRAGGGCCGLVAALLATRSMRDGEQVGTRSAGTRRPASRTSRSPRGARQPADREPGRRPQAVGDHAGFGPEIGVRIRPRMHDARGPGWSAARPARNRHQPGALRVPQRGHLVHHRVRPIAVDCSVEPARPLQGVPQRQPGNSRVVDVKSNSDSA